MNNLIYILNNLLILLNYIFYYFIKLILLNNNILINIYKILKLFNIYNYCSLIFFKIHYL